MSEEQNKLSDFNDLIHEKMGELIDLRSNTWKWLATEHTIKDTEARLNEARTISEELSQIAHGLVDHKKAVPADAKEVDSSFKIFDLVRGYEREIHECLNRDLDAKKKAASDNKFDYVKNVAFILSVPGLFITGVKNGVGNGHIDVNEALVLGFAVSIPTVFHKKTKSLFSKAAKNICSVPTALMAVPASIGSDMRVVYVREIVKEKTNSAQVCFATAAKSINDNVKATRAQMTVGLGRLFGRRGPRP
jgi:hypothetical protein